MMVPAIVAVALLLILLWRLHKMAVDLTAEFANLSKAIADLPGRIAAAQAGQIQASDVQAAADAAAATITALPLPPAA